MEILPMVERSSYEELKQRIRHLEVENEKLTVAEEKYHQSFESTSGALILIETETGLVLDLNKTALEVYGYSREDALRMKYTDFWQEPDKTQQSTAELESSIYCGYHRKKDGTGFPAEISVRHFMLKGKKVCVASIRDISERKSREKCFRTNETRYRKILQTAIDGFCWVDQQFRLKEVNDAYCRMSGYSKEELLAMSVFDLVASQTPAEISDLGQRIMAQGKHSFEAKHRRKDGSIFDVEASVQYHSSEEGWFVGFVRDITKRKQAEEALRESEDRYRSVIEGSIQGILIHQDSIIIYANQAASRLFGYDSPKELVGLNVWETIIAPEWVPDIKQRVADVLKGIEVSVHQGWQGIRKDGTRVWVQTTANRIFWKGRPAVAGFQFDITDRKRSEDELIRSERRFREMAEHIREVFWLFDWKEQKVLYVSPAYEEIWGRTAEDLYSRYEEWAESIYPEDLCHAQDSFSRILESGGGESRDYRIVRPDGSIRWISDRGFAIRDETGDVVRIAGVAEDITDRKQNEIALQDKDKTLERQSRHLEETNTALKVLLQHQQEEKRNLEQRILINVRKLVFPYLEKLQSTSLDNSCRTYLAIAKSNLENLVSPFMGALSSKYTALTPTEVQIADLIKHGKGSKEIASLLNVSIKAISFHRGNIRKKLGLSNQKINLRSYLQSITDKSSTKY
jgi:PAS domain S-box-containing protein